MRPQKPAPEKDRAALVTAILAMRPLGHVGHVSRATLETLTDCQLGARFRGLRRRFRQCIAEGEGRRGVADGRFAAPHGTPPVRGRALALALEAAAACRRRAARPDPPAHYDGALRAGDLADGRFYVGFARTLRETWRTPGPDPTPPRPYARHRTAAAVASA